MASSAAQTFAYRLQKDLKEVNTMKWLDSPALALSPVDDRIEHMVALVMGPPDCPYHSAFFFIDMRFPPEYPNEPPRCRFLSSDNGRVRMNPNLYADGKICLSILGTWRGETAEVWRSSYSAAYVLQAVQCVIMNCEPFYNEPGFERETLLQEPKKPKGDPKEGEKKPRRTYTREELDKSVDSYSQKIWHESLRISVCDVLESIFDIRPPPVPVPLAQPLAEEATSPADDASPGPDLGSESPAPENMNSPGGITPGQGTPVSVLVEGVQQPTFQQPLAPAARGTGRHPLHQHIQAFRNEIVRQFAARYESYIAVAQERVNLDGQAFIQQPFEFPNNGCVGLFNFAQLCSRLENIQRAVLAETNAWALKGRELTQRMAYVASSLQEEARSFDSLGLCISGGPVEPDNVFEWQFSLMSPEGLYEESSYRIHVVFHPELQESPKVKFVQSIWHPNISPSGVPLYFCTDNDTPISRRFLPSTVAAALAQLMERPPMVASTTWVNIEAGKGCFSGNAAEQKEFKRKARLLSRRSMEE